MPAPATRPDVLYTSDLHGSRAHYRETLRIAREERVRAIVLGGDLAPGADPAGQKAFHHDFLVPLLRDYFAGPDAAELYYIFGNGDWRANETALEEARLPRVHYLQGRVVPFLDGTLICGFACVPPTPIALKDWERWEDDKRGTGFRPEGYRSTLDGGIVPFSFTGREQDESLAFELAALRAEVDRARSASGVASGDTTGGEAPLVCVFHGPPHGTACDQIEGGVHVGSRAARRFLEETKPRVALHGHIHESPVISGRFAELLGPTVCVNPGQQIDRFHAVTFRLDDPLGTLRHTVYGAHP